jgi:NADH dehydrogenase
MKIAITGGTGFVGRNLTQRLASEGHDVVIVARGAGGRKQAFADMPNVSWVRSGLDNVAALTQAFSGCDGVAHCAGINREIGSQTYDAVHVRGTSNVVQAARAAAVSRITMLSFLRARPACGSGYHESKFAAEEIVRGSGIDYTILKAGVIYGEGDHMLDHLSHAFFTFPLFALVGFRDRPLRPVAVADVVSICRAALIDGRLSNRTVAVLGPEQLLLREAVQRVAAVVGRRPLFFRAPIWFHLIVGWITEKLMTTPMVSLAQVRILSEGIVDPSGMTDELPQDLAPATPFDETSIRAGLPKPGRFGASDLRPCVALRSAVGAK